MRRALASCGVVALAACVDPVSPPTARFCGVDTVRVPVTVDTVTYEEIIIVPRRCPG